MALGCHLLTVHPEAAVAGDMDDSFIGIAQLCAQRRTQTEAHGTKAAGGQKLTGIIKMEMLDGPHLMLSHIRCNNGVLRHQIANGLQHLLGCQLAGLVLILGVGGIGEYKLLPPVIVLLLHSFV